LSIDSGLGNVPKAQKEELQYVPMVGREQFPQWTHDTSGDRVVR
jgi:hypothetical protein